MRGLLRLLTAGVLATLTLSLSAYAVTISARVVDLARNRRGIPAVEIKLQTYGEKPVEVSTYTDAEGRFKLTGVPRVARAKLTASRRGWQNYPTILFINTEKESADDVFMVAEGGTAEYYRSFASEIAKTDPSKRRQLRAIWFNLPEADAAMVRQEFAALGGDPEDEHLLYLAERDLESGESRDDVQRYATTDTSSTMTPGVGDVDPTPTRTRMRKD